MVFVALAAATAVDGVPTAWALPPLPLAPTCTDYVYPSSFELMQDNGILVAINDNGDRFDGGGASYTVPGKPDVTGISTGRRTGRSIDISVNWSNGFSNHYTGQIGDDLVARGSTVNNLGTSNSWYSLAKFTCVTPAPPPPPPPPPPPSSSSATPPPPAGTSATATGDVDVYDAPGGGGNVTGTLRQGRSVQLVERRPDNWCHVTGASVPGGDGWVWGDFIS
ncbi:SH3 domain-containing protein [Mycobacterium yunnanensis]|uniref:SH3 domain-containing protein n=1 Tax=Mycobacterium yunnanensis TaxID=368477 RepID=A0A9X2Z829_9MYCO|nr:SH3 domain-containing protein [Mycobacterium yunnanensis]MCV7424780.1 SH3 domain-containing protein [Mycobacterium yunnanensis]